MGLQQVDSRWHKAVADIFASRVKPDVPLLDMSAQRDGGAVPPQLPHIAHHVVVNEQNVLAAREEQDDVPVSRGAGSKCELQQRVVTERSKLSSKREFLFSPDE